MNALLTRCTERESGGYQCEVFLTSPDEPHNHFISQATIAEATYRPFYLRLDYSGLL